MSITVAVTTEAVAAAQPNTGHHAGGNPAGNVGASDGVDQSVCAFLKLDSSWASDAAQENYAAGDRKRGRHFEQVADDDFQQAHDMGCGWAA